MYNNKTFHNNPVISVVIPTYRRPDMLREALLSILGQSFGDFEVIVVNDAGEDVKELIDSLNSEKKLIYIRHEENRGVAAARNTALMAARGKYIAYLDDDDIYYPDHLETLVEFLESSGYKIAYTDSYQAFQTWVADEYVTTRKEVTYSNDFDRQKLLVSNYIPTLNIAHRRDILDKIGLFDEKLETHEDWDLWIRISLKYDFWHIKKITAEFRSYSDKTSKTSRNLTSFLNTLKIIHSRYLYAVTDPEIIKNQKQAEDALSLQVEIRKKSSIIADYELQHLYSFVRGFVKGSKVLDIACGNGYGSSIIADEASEVIGIDTDAANIRHATFRYIRNNLRFIKGSITEIPIEGVEIFDVIVCLDALGDANEYRKLLKEVKRLLKKGGLFIVSIINKGAQSSIGSAKSGFNPEGLCFDETNQLLSENFRNIIFYGHKIYPSSNIFPLMDKPTYLQRKELVIEKSNDGFIFSSSEKKKPAFFIAVSSDSFITHTMGNSYLVDVSETLMRLMDMQDERIGTLEIEVKNLETVLRDRNKHIENLDVAIKDKNAHIEELETTIRNIDIYKATITEKNMQINRLENEIVMKNDFISAMRNTMGWKLLERSRNLRNKLLPANSLRRSFYDKVIKSLKIIEDQGFKALAKKIRGKLAQNADYVSKPYSTKLSEERNKRNKFKKSIRPAISVLPSSKACIKADKHELQKNLDNIKKQLLNNLEYDK